MFSSPILAFIDVGGPEFICIILIALMLYGGRLPEVARKVGRTVGEFKRSADQITREFKIGIDDDNYESPFQRQARRRKTTLKPTTTDDEEETSTAKSNSEESEPKPYPPEDPSAAADANVDDDEVANAPSEERKREVRLDPLPDASPPDQPS